jgi:hypothetical protein
MTCTDMAEDRRAGKLARPTGGRRPKGNRVSKKPDSPKSLGEQKIDKNLAHSARKLAELDEAFADALRGYDEWQLARAWVPPSSTLRHAA